MNIGKIPTFVSPKGTTIAGYTSGVSGVDDAEDAWIAVLPGFCDGSSELCNIQTPTVVFV